MQNRKHEFARPGAKTFAAGILLLMLTALGFAADVRVVRRSRPLLPREGEAISQLITNSERRKKGFRSEPNRQFVLDRLRRNAEHGLDRVDTVRTLALRVEFQEDSSELTTGNGKMDYAGFLDSTHGLLYDPPHTRTYFQNMMVALRNYYALNSLGKCLITSDVFPLGESAAYQLPHDMLYYGDTISGEGIETGLTRLMYDAIKAADADPTLSFADYDVIAIFHAGSTGQTDTPYDSPFDLLSGTLGVGALEAYLGVPYILADEGRTRVTAATILPEMARQDTLYDGELNILGMTGLEGLVYHEYNHLLGGLDLYDVTGWSMGVGAPSLMGYGGWLGDWGLGVPPGTIPSMLDPWHRVLYGWVEPLVVNVPRENIPLHAAEMESLAYHLYQDTTLPTVIKVPIAGGEYYLIENRQADTRTPDTLWVHAEGGVPIWVKDGEYDFFLPGSGVYIWHVDENVIADYGPYNAINIFPEHKGVDVVEGDGIQDFDGFSGRASFDYQIYGSATDPYFVGGFNDSLNARTTPNSDGYQGRNFISVAVNSGNDTIMPVSIGFELNQPGFPQDPGRVLPYSGATYADINAVGLNQFVVADTGGRISAWNSDGTSFLSGRANGIFSQIPGGTTASAPVCADITGDAKLEVIAASKNGRVYAWTSTATTVPGFPVTAGDRVTATPVTSDLDHDGRPEIIIGSTDGKLHAWRGDGTELPGFPVTLNSEVRAAVALTDSANPQIVVLGSDGRLFLVNPDGTIAPGFPRQLGQGSLYTLAAPVTGDIDRDGNREIVAIVSGGYDYKLYVIDLAGNIRYQSRTEIRHPFYGTPALADVSGDGCLDIIVAAKNFIYAFNPEGTLVSNYPITLDSVFVTTEIAGNWLITFETEFLFNSSPVVADLDADGVLDIAVGSPQYGLLAFNSRTGKRLSFAPLGTVAPVSATPLVCNLDGDAQLELAVGTDQGQFHVWQLPGDPARIAWGGFLGNPQHTGLYPDRLLPEVPAPSATIADKFYVYPNPAERHATARFTLGAVTNASARIRILDVAGLPLLEMTAPAYPSADNEQRFSTTNLPSGVYIMRLEVKSDQGTSVKFYKLGIQR